MDKTSLCFCYLIQHIAQNTTKILYLDLEMHFFLCTVMQSCLNVSIWIYLSFLFFDFYLFSTCQSFIITSHSTKLKKDILIPFIPQAFLTRFFKHFKNSGTSSSCHKVAISIPLVTCVPLLSLSTL